MPRTLFVTQGEYAGRYMRLEDDMAEKALADGWARESEQEPEPKKGAKKSDADLPEPQETPASLAEFENPEEEAAANGDEPTAPRRGRKRHSS